MPSPAACTPPSETCNGTDDYCDTVCDNGFDCCQGVTGEACVNPVGVDGTRDCDLSCNWTACCAPAEICNNHYDDDCDGNIDYQKLGSDIQITSDPADSIVSSFIWTGSEHGIAWWDNRDGPDYEIYFARTSLEGIKYGSDIRITNVTGQSYTPSLQWTGSEYGITWRDDRDGNAEIYFTRISSVGSKIGSDIRVTEQINSSRTPSLQWAESEFGLAWSDDRNISDEEIYFVRITSTGTIIGSEVRITNSVGYSRYPSLKWTGSEYGVACYDTRDGMQGIFFVRISNIGIKLDSDILVTETSSDWCPPSLQWTGSEFGIVWADTRDGNEEIYFARISLLGLKIGVDVIISNDPAQSMTPSLKWNGSEYGVVWTDNRGGSELYFAHISSSGSKIDNDIRITNNPSDKHYPFLQWNSSEFSVVWVDNRDSNNEIYFARIGCLP